MQPLTQDILPRILGQPQFSKRTVDVLKNQPLEQEPVRKSVARNS
jgi:hypothetical protein